MLTIALYGDSIGRGVTYDPQRGRYVYLKQGFDKLMQQSGAAQFINRSRFGATAREGLTAFLADETIPCDAVAIQYGGNDCTPDWQAIAGDPEGSHEAKTGLDAFVSDLTAFVEAVRQRGQTPILITPPPLVAQRYVDWITKELDRGRILSFLGDVHHVYRWQEQYALAVHQAARATACNLFDLRAWYLKERVLSDLYCVDGMHPNQRGHEVIAQAAAIMLPRLISGQMGL